jgi:hypothetical protein
LKEKDFINKIHKKLPKEIYKWKINDPYHGGVPDTFYSGPAGFAFFEYKYIQQLPKRGTSKRQYEYSMPVYYIIGAPDLCVVSQDFQKEFFTLDEFLKHAMPIKEFIDKISNICLHNKED